MSLDTIAGLGTIVGSLIGIIIFLLRQLVASKNEQIKRLEEEVRAVIAERDLFRELLLTRRSNGGG